MAIVPKTGLYGIDVVINDLQNYSDPALLGRWAGLPLAQYQSLPRANKNYKEPDKKIPEISDDDFNYSEVLFNDKYAVTSFFLIEDVRNLSDETKLIKSRVSIIFQANLKKIYGAATRQDEQFNMEVLDIFAADNIWINSDIEIAEGVDQVYSDLILPAPLKAKINNNDISHFHVVKFSFDVLHKRECFAKVPLRCPGGVGPVTTAVNTIPTGVDTPAGDPLAINVVDTGDVTVPVVLITNTANEKKLQVPAAAVVLPFRSYTGQKSSSQDFDDKYYKDAGQYDGGLLQDLYTLYANAIVDGFTPYSHLFRYTGETGGYYNHITATYHSEDGTDVGTHANAFPNGLIRDQLTKYEWYFTGVGDRTWTLAISQVEALTFATHDDWTVPTIKQLENIKDTGLSTPYSNGIFSFGSNLWSSSHNTANTTQAWYVDTAGRSLLIAKTASRRRVLIRRF